MKSLKRLSAFVLCITLLLGICGCSTLKGASSDGDGGFYGPPLIGGSGEGADFSGSTAPDSPSSDAAGDTVPDAGESTDESAKPDDAEDLKNTAGLMTAGAWNDNENYADWIKLFDQNSDEIGKFAGYIGQNSWGFDSSARIKVTVGLTSDENARVAGAEVVAKDADGSDVFRALTDANGVAYLFTDAEPGTLTVTSGDYSATIPYTAGFGEELEVKLDGGAEKKNVIDIMFVVDVTGSMGDELYFLKNELADVIDKVAKGSADSTINLALLFYRDNGDKEKFSYHDFTNVTTADGLNSVQAALDAQRASGGGDYPEAVDEALELAVGKQWNTAATTKLIFHVLDAPHHSKESDINRYKNAVEVAAEKGIRICPILCSGAEGVTEYVTRQAAIYTAGTFIFVTDDSGIGNTHHDPGLPNVTIEALNSLLVRIIGGYHTGEFAEPVYWREDQAIKQG